MAQPLTSIEKEKLLIVEGADEQNVFDWYFRKIGVTDIQIIDGGGKDQIASNFPALIKTRGFIDLKSYAILRDADESAASAFQSIQGILRNNGQPVPKAPEEYIENNGLKVGVFILPGSGENGMLETLYLRSLEGTELLRIVDECVEELKVHYPPLAENTGFQISRNTEKVRAHGTMMATKKTLNRLGLVASAGYWDFEHASLDSLKVFLAQL